MAPVLDIARRWLNNPFDARGERCVVSIMGSRTRYASDRGMARFQSDDALPAALRTRRAMPGVGSKSKQLRFIKDLEGTQTNTGRS